MHVLLANAILRRLAAGFLAFPLAVAGPARAASGPADPDTPIPAVHVFGATSARTVSIHGGVTRVERDGFFVQRPGALGDPPSADALFVFTRTRPALQAGQCVRVRGRPAVFGDGWAAAHPVLELRADGAPQVLEGRCDVAPVDLALPAADPARFEGRLVRLRGPLTVQQDAFLCRYGELTLAPGGRLEVPTNRLPPGPQAQALAGENARRILVLDDADAPGDPAPAFAREDAIVRVGDTIPGLVGVVAWGPMGAERGAWKIRPTQPVRLASANPRPAAPPAVGGTLRVASANLDNWFSTIADGHARCGPRREAAECRGARSLPEFERQRAKLAAMLLGLDADVVALMEVENNGATALQSLVDALDARAGPGAWARVADPAEGGGDDAIKVALIYRPARVRPVGAARADADAIHNRRPIAQTFETVQAGAGGATGAAGARFNVVAVHFKSRRCEDAAGAEADQGDLQGCWNHRRVLQARALREFARRVQADSGVADTLLVGDFNAYAHEAPFDELAGHGFADQAARFDPDGYSFVFDGMAGRIDQAFASPALAARVTGLAEWHVNADEAPCRDAAHAGGRDAATPYRASDHDPFVLGLRLP